MSTKSHATMHNRKKCLAATNLPAPVCSAAYSSHGNLILPGTTGGPLLTQKLLTQSPLYADLAYVCTSVGPLQLHHSWACQNNFLPLKMPRPAEIHNAWF